MDPLPVSWDTGLEDNADIAFDGGGPGQAKKPTLACDDHDIDIPLFGSGETARTAAP